MSRMKYIFNNRMMLAAAAAALLFASCENDDIPVTVEEPVVEFTAGSADFSSFVAIGNSLTAGFTDNALFIIGQQQSFPNLLAQKFALGGGGDFSQPLMADNIGGALLGGNQILGPRLYFDGAGPAPINQVPTTEISNIAPGPYNNMGVPGAKSYHLLAPGYGNLAGVQAGLANPYFVRMASSPNATMLADAASQNPSFVSIWVGNNDVLGYATSGGAGVDQTGNPDVTTYGGSDITDPTAFAGIMSQIIGTLGAGAQGVVLNIPDVTSIPFLTTVPFNPVPLDAGTANAVNGGYALYNGGLLQAQAAGLLTQEEVDQRTINFVEGDNAVVIEDEYLTDLSALGLPSLRQTTADDLLPLTGASFIGTTVNNDPTLINGVTVPLADQWALTVNEINEIATATASYNSTIAALANQNGLILIDANSILSDISTNGAVFDEFQLNGSLVFGGVFSLDGVHPTARGNAFLANIILRAIDEAYGSNFEASGSLLKAVDFTTLYPEVLP